MVIDSETFTGNFADVRAFCQVMELGTLSAAGRYLGQSKGAISRRISRLEAAVGVRLLARTSRAVTPTEEGLTFHARARAGLAMMDEASLMVRSQVGIARGHLRITTSIDVSVELLPPLIARFRALHPHITLEILATDALLDLVSQRVDLALRIGFGNLPDQGYRGVELARGNIACYAAPQWLLHNAPPQTPADLENYCLIVFNRRSAERAYSFANRTGQTVAVHLRASVRVSDLATALRIAEAGAGIVLLPDIITARALEAGSLVPILADWRISGIKLHALTLIGRVPARVRLFREFLKSELRTPRLANRT